jgi:hypothetical protein
VTETVVTAAAPTVTVVIPTRNAQCNAVSQVPTPCIKQDLSTNVFGRTFVLVPSPASIMVQLNLRLASTQTAPASR